MAEEAELSGAVPTHVVAVEDDEMVTKLLERILRDVPDVELVGVASTASDARQMVATQNPDVVLMDATLPDGDGVDLASDLVASSGVRVLILTGSATPDRIEAARAVGCAGIIVKTPRLRDHLAADLRSAAKADHPFIEVTPRP